LLELTLFLLNQTTISPHPVIPFSSPSLDLENTSLLQLGAFRTQVLVQLVSLEGQSSERLACAQILWNGAGQVVVSNVEDGKVGEGTEALRNGTGELVAEEKDLVEACSVGKRRGNRAGELVVGQREVQSREGTDAVGKLARELVVVQEQSLNLREGCKDLGGDGSGEGVVADVQEGQLVGGECAAGEGAGQLVVAEVQLVQVVQRTEVGDVAGETVAVGMEKGKVQELIEEAGQLQVALQAVVGGKVNRRKCVLVRVRVDCAVEAAPFA